MKEFAPFEQIGALQACVEMLLSAIDRSPAGVRKHFESDPCARSAANTAREVLAQLATAKSTTNGETQHG